MKLITLRGSQIRLDPPEGWGYRVRSCYFIFTGVAVTGDQPVITFDRTGSLFAAVGPVVLGIAVNISASFTTPPVTTIAAATANTMTLPDIVWDAQVLITVDVMAGGVVSPGSVVWLIEPVKVLKGEGGP